MLQAVSKLEAGLSDLWPVSLAVKSVKKEHTHSGRGLHTVTIQGTTH